MTRMTPPDDDRDTDEGDSLPEYYARQTFTDCAGKRRAFDLTIVDLPGHGFSGQALEVTKARHGGYQFRSFAQGSKPLALARLRKSIQAGLAQRFLIQHDGHLEMPMERLQGRIGADGVVVDGKLLTWEDFQTFLTTYEGFAFELKIPFEPQW